jgi:phytanoyl-CoA hydroxylase
MRTGRLLSEKGITMATAGIATLEAVDLAAAAEQYVTQGFVLVKNLLTNDEAAAYRTESHRLLKALGGQDDPTWA